MNYNNKGIRSVISYNNYQKFNKKVKQAFQYRFQMTAINQKEKRFISKHNQMQQQLIFQMLTYGNKNG